MNSTHPVPPTPQKMNENNYDINMTFGEGNKVHVDMKKQPAAKQQASADEETDSDEESGEKVLKDLLRPKVSETYQIEIDKLENLIKMFKHLPISEDPAKKDHAIEQLKATITILMTQAQSLIKEMKQMSRRNSYYKNNIMLATFILDKCRMDAPETEEDFENMFGENESNKSNK
jgi:chemotaxis protein histidine kinase CheA